MTVWYIRVSHPGFDFQIFDKFETGPVSLRFFSVPRANLSHSRQPSHDLTALTQHRVATHVPLLDPTSRPKQQLLGLCAISTTTIFYNIIFHLSFLSYHFHFKMMVYILRALLEIQGAMWKFLALEMFHKNNCVVMWGFHVKTN